MDTLNNNKLIAEFMNLTLHKGYIYKYYPLSERKERGFWGNQLQYHESKLKYDKSWDWLMPVIYKIGKLPSLGDKPHPTEDNIGIFSNITRKLSELRDIDIVYIAVLEFIKWYNLNKR